MTNLKVLIVEEDAIVVAHLKHILEQAGYQVVGLVACGEDAVTQAASALPDIILMDMRLCGSMTGIEAAWKIHQQSDTPIVFLTAYADDALLQEAKQTQPFGFLVKPIREEALFAAIAMAISKHQTERRLVHLMSVLRAVRGIHRLITHQHDPSNILKRACKILYGTRGYRLVWIGLLDPSGRRVQPVASTGARISYLSRFHFDLDDPTPKNGPVMTAVQTGKAVACNNVAANQNPELILKVAIAHGFDSGAVIPMRYQQHIFGVLAVYANRPNAFDAEEVALLQEVAEDLAYGLQAIEAETLRKNMEKSLRESEARYRTVADYNYDWEYWIALDGKWIYSSPSCERITGYAPEQFLSDPQFIYQIFHENDRETIRQHHAPDKGWSEGIDLRILRKDGELRWINHVCHPIYDEQGTLVGTRCSNRDITDRKRTEDALLQSEKQYRQIIDTSAEGILMVDEDSKLRFVNRRLIQYLGYSREELLHQDVRLFLFPEAIEAYNGAIEAMRTSVPGRYKGRMRRKDGGEFWVLVSTSPMFDEHNHYLGALAMLTDINDQNKAGYQLKRRITELEVIYENGLALGRLMEPKEIGQLFIDLLAHKLPWQHLAVWYADPKTDLMEVLAYKHLEVPQEEIDQEMAHIKRFVNAGRGLIVWAYQHDENVVCADVTRDPRYIPTFAGIKSAFFAPIKAGHKVIGVFVLQSKQENAFDPADVRLVTTLVHQVGIAIENARLYQTAQEEVSMRKQIEIELLGFNEQLERRVAERTEELRIANATLERSSRMKDEFLASMSHELRTPLTGVLNLSEVLQEQVYGPFNEKQIQLLQTIEASGRHLLGLINDILDLSKIEAGQLELQIENCSVGEICQSSLQLVRGMSQKKHQMVSFTIKPTNIVLRGDARRIKQMLVNLLSNAVKFTPEGGKIGLQVEGDEQQNEVRFTVWDTGIGIAPEDLLRLFKPFTQLDSRLSHAHSGTGLGLALVKRMVDLHQGVVGAKSNLGEGSQFTVTLPWKTAPPADLRVDVLPTYSSEEPLQPNRSERPGALILLVDDNEVNSNIYTDYLRVKGYQVITVSRGEDAVRLAQEYHPDLILMDIQMPGMDGLTAIRQIRSNNGQSAPVPIIALTALAMVGDRECCLQAGADDYLSKPVSLQELISTMQKYLQKVRS